MSLPSWGSLFSLFIAGYLPACIGRRKTVLVTSVWMSVAFAIFASGFGGSALLPLACLMVGIARGFQELGVELYATSGTCDVLTEEGIACKRVNRVSQAHPNILDMIASGTVDLIINTPTKGRKHDTDGFKIRRSAVEHSVGCVTSIDTARALLTVRQQSRSEDLTPIDITKI